MKKTIYTLSILAAALLAVSCQKDSEYMQQESSVTVLKATAETVGNALTRIHMSYGFDVLWNEGDQICVKNTTTSATYTLQEGAGTTDGTFACATSPFTSGTQVEAFYPKTVVDNGNFIWPARQTRSSVMPMYCKRTLAATGSQSLRFKSLGGILQIVFSKNYQSTSNIKAVKIEDGSKTLSGAFIVDSEGKAVITATDKAGINLEVSMETPGYGAYTMNVALPAGTYDNLRLTFTNKDGKGFVSNVSEPVTIKQNGITKLNVVGKSFIDLTPSTGYTKANINGYEVDVPWVRLWYKGPKFAAYNVGVTDGNPMSRGDYFNWGMSLSRLGVANSDYNTGSSTLTGNDDTATAVWGPNWRMPTKEEMETLNSKQCIQEFGNNELVFKGLEYSDYKDNSITLPMANAVEPDGECCGKYVSVGMGGGYVAYGSYWTSTPADDGKAYFLSFLIRGSSENIYISPNQRYMGSSIRAVVKE